MRKTRAHSVMAILAALAGLTLASSVVAFAAPAPVPAPPPAPATAPTYALLSLVGDKLDIVIAQYQSDLNGGKARREPPLDLDDPVFDNTAAASAGDGVRRVVPAAELAVLNSRSPVLFAKQAELFAEKNGVLAIPEAIRAALKNEKADFLVLIMKYRGEPEFQFAGFPESGGQIEGLGFYLDGAMGASNRDTNEAGRGYIAPFASMQVAVADALTGKLVGRRIIKSSTIISSARAQDGETNPWAAMTSSEKVNAINRLLQRELVRAVPQILRGDPVPGAEGEIDKGKSRTKPETRK